MTTFAAIAIALPLTGLEARALLRAMPDRSNARSVLEPALRIPRDRTTRVDISPAEATSIATQLGELVADPDRCLRLFHGKKFWMRSLFSATFRLRQLLAHGRS